MEIVDNIRTVRNGVEALDYLEQTRSEPEAYPMPDLILLDLNMPLMNGWEFLEAYSQLPGELRKSVVVVMLTTSLRPEDQSRAETLGLLRGLIHKPLTQEAVKDILHRHFSEN